MATKLFRVILPAPNVSEMAAFYASLLGDEGEPIAGGTRHYFDCGGTILALADPGEHGNPSRPNADNVYLAVDDLEEIHRRATTLKATALTDIEERPWGERSFYCTDPYGNPLCFVDVATMFTGESG